MSYYLLFAAAGYMLGSILFAPLFGQMIMKKDIISGTKDQNPGTANAFMEGGMVCGVLTLICDIGKGFLPVFLCLNLGGTALGHVLWGPSERLWGGRPEWVCTFGLALVLLAPVFGHTFSLYHRFQGGKGIAATFGSLLGYAPNLFPALILAFFFLLFTLVIRICPHFYRTIVTYVCSAGMFFVWGEDLAQKLGFLLITVVVCIRMHLSIEERREVRVELLWMH